MACRSRKAGRGLGPACGQKEDAVRTVALQGVRNVRDLGGITAGDGHVVRAGLLYRGSAPYDATPSDWRVLAEGLGVTCVIDLRCGWECEEHPCSTPSNVEYLHIPFYDLEKVGIEYTEAVTGTKVVGRDVACDPQKFYHSLSNPLTAGQMRRALEHIFDRVSRQQAVYFHCSGGKDRAGVLAALILHVLGANSRDVLDDYLLTNVDRDKDRDQLFARFLRLANGDENRARELVLSHRALPENLDAFYAGVNERYGSLESFISNQLGMHQQRRSQFREACTQPV